MKLFTLFSYINKVIAREVQEPMEIVNAPYSENPEENFVKLLKPIELKNGDIHFVNPPEKGSYDDFKDKQYKLYGDLKNANI